MGQEHRNRANPETEEMLLKTMSGKLEKIKEWS